MGSSNENSAYGPVRNPVRHGSRTRRLQRRFGRSGGGRNGRGHAGHRHRRLDSPAGVFCGVVGVLPTYGRVSRYGLIAFASSLDRVGHLQRMCATPQPCSASSPDTIRMDATIRRCPCPTTQPTSTSRWTALRIGVPDGIFRRRPRPRSPRSRRAGIDQLARRRLHHQADLAAAHALRHSHVLRDRHGGSQRQPRAL